MSGSTEPVDERTREPTPTGERAGSGGPAGDVIRRLVLLGTPLALAVVMLIHPHSGDEVYANLAPVADTFLLVHVAVLFLFGLLGVGVYLLLAGHRSRLATVGRAGVATYGFFYLFLVAVQGVTTGLLVREGQALLAEQQEGVAAVVQYLHTEPLIFAAGVLGAVGYLVAISAAAVVLSRAGAPRAPLALLVASVLAVGAHSGPVAALGMVCFFAAVAWLEFGWAPADATSTAAGAA